MSDEMKSHENFLKGHDVQAEWIEQEDKVIKMKDEKLKDVNLRPPL